MKISIDCRTLTAIPSGTSSYLITAINEMSRQNPSWTFYLLIHKNLHPEANKLLLKRENILIVKKPFFIFRNISIIWYLLKTYCILKDLKPDIFWAPGHILPPWIPSKMKTMVTVHDLVPKKYKQTMAFITKVVSHFLFDKSIQNADILWAVSKYTRLEIEKNYPHRKCKDIFLGSGVDKSVFKKMNLPQEEKQRLLEKFKISENFLLFVGTLEPRKNLKFLLSLMPDISKLGFSLLVVGSEGWGKKKINSILNQQGYPKDHIFFSGLLTTEELIRVFNMASIYISTSINEGFGLPQLEAMVCGCPVVTSHNSGMIEVVEGAGETVKGWERKDWIEALSKVYLNREKYVQQGLKRAEEFNLNVIIKDLTRRLETERRLEKGIQRRS